MHRGWGTKRDAGPRYVLKWCGKNIIDIIVVGHQDIIIPSIWLHWKFPVRSEYFFQLDWISGGVLHMCSTFTWWINVLHLQLMLLLVIFSAVPRDFLLWSLILGNTLKLYYLWVLAMFRTIHPWFHVAGCVWLVSRGSDGKKIAKSCWDVGWYSLGCRGAIGLMWLHKCGSRIFACLFYWDGLCRGNRHDSFVGSQ